MAQFKQSDTVNMLQRDIVCLLLEPAESRLSKRFSGCMNSCVFLQDCRAISKDLFMLLEKQERKICLKAWHALMATQSDIYISQVEGREYSRRNAQIEKCCSGTCVRV